MSAEHCEWLSVKVFTSECNTTNRLRWISMIYCYNLYEYSAVMFHHTIPISIVYSTSIPSRVSHRFIPPPISPRIRPPPQVTPPPGTLLARHRVSNNLLEASNTYQTFLPPPLFTADNPKMARPCKPNLRHPPNNITSHTSEGDILRTSPVDPRDPLTTIPPLLTSKPMPFSSPPPFATALNIPSHPIHHAHPSAETRQP
ncbi:hypothetical protein J3F83DRAFT_355927 [Trichoderma novae-zelandiae]